MNRSSTSDADSRNMPEPPESRAAPREYMPRPSCRCAILCLKRALDSKMDSMGRTAQEAEFKGKFLAGFSGWRAVCFAVHFGIQTGSIG